MTAGLDEGSIAIKGNATPDDVAAVLATLREMAARTAAASRYDRWRDQRIAALRTAPTHVGRVDPA